jgi:hypothetical protein
MATPKSKPQTQKSTPSGAPAGAEDLQGLRINYGGCSLPNVLSRVYKYSPFDRAMEVVTEGGEHEKIVVKDKIKAAWSVVWKRADHAPCNGYFKTLVKRKSLKEVLQEGGLTLHYLEPKDGKSFDKLPAANSAGHDIAINPNYLLDNEPGALACTLIHELAHVAGATTNTRDQHALDAENAMKHCGCKFDEGNKG